MARSDLRTSSKMVVKSSSKGVLDNDNVKAHPVSIPGVLLEHGRTQHGQIVLQMTMSLKDGPEDIRHGQNNAHKGDVR